MQALFALVFVLYAHVQVHFWMQALKIFKCERATLSMFTQENRLALCPS